MNDLLAALLLGIIEGITEFLPISSTGHLLIAERWLGHRSDLFNISIQAGAILAVVVIYRERLLALARGFGERNKRDYTLKLLLAFGVTAALGVVVKKLGFALPETIAPVAWALLLGGFVILGVEAIDARRADLPDDDPNAIGWGTAVLVGLAQVLAGVFPGTSRSAAAIFAALLFGKSSRLAATEFAFLVGIPTMFAATGYELVRMLRDGSAANEDWTALAVAFVASAITAFVAVKWLLRYIQTHRFTIFAWYRIALGALLLAWLYFGVASPVPAAFVEPGAAAPSKPVEVVPDHNAMGPLFAGARARESDPAARIPSDDDQRAADIARFRRARLCLWAAIQRPGLAHATVEHFVVAPDNKNFTDADRERQLQEAHAFYDAMERADAECAESAPEFTDGSIYELALRAADAGDAVAASCYVSGAFHMPAELWDRPNVRQRFAENAERLIERGLRAGDWSIAQFASLRYAPKRWPYRRPAVAAPPQVPPGIALVMTAFEAGDIDRAYAILRLRQLGAAHPDDRRSNALHLDEYLGKQMGPERVRAAEAWARNAFVRDFRSQHWERPDMEPCLRPERI